MKLIMEGFRQYLEELDFDFSTFELKKELNPKIWKGEKLRPEVAKKLREIVDDFWSDIDLKDVGIVDIIITGSAANYNWSEKSDIDLHILVNFNDDNYTEQHEDLLTSILMWADLEGSDWSWA